MQFFQNFSENLCKKVHFYSRHPPPFVQTTIYTFVFWEKMKTPTGCTNVSRYHLYFCVSDLQTTHPTPYTSGTFVLAPPGIILVSVFILQNYHAELQGLPVSLFASLWDNLLQTLSSIYTASCSTRLCLPVFCSVSCTWKLFSYEAMVTQIYDQTPHTLPT